MGQYNRDERYQAGFGRVTEVPPLDVWVDLIAGCGSVHGSRYDIVKVVPIWGESNLYKVSMMQKT